MARCISDVRTALGDTRQDVVGTVPRRGCAPGDSGRTSVTNDRPRSCADFPWPPSPTGGRWGLFPLRQSEWQISERDHFAERMAEEIITALSRISWLFVVARSSSFLYKGRGVDAAQIGRELGVRYVVEGSVRRSGEQVRITVQLIDAHGGAHLWADRFDGQLQDIFDLQAPSGS